MVYLLARNGRVATNALEHNHLWFEQNAKDKWGDDIAGVYEAATYALLKNQAQADTLLKRFHLRDAKLEYSWTMSDYYSTLGRASQYIYLLSRHFPERLRSLKPDDIMSLADPIMSGEFNTLSSAQAIMALDSYGRAMKEKFVPGNVEIDQLIGKVSKKLELSQSFYPEGSFARGTDALVFKKTGTNPVPGLFYQIAESGFEQNAITKPLSTGIEVSREYFRKEDLRNPVTSAKLGEELTVVLRVRSTENQELSNVAILDLLPGGFEIVEESARTGRCSYGWGEIEYVDVREDRLLAFGTVSGGATVITYRIKATNHGTYAIPPPQAESMYHLKIRARGVTGSLTVAD